VKKRILKTILIVLTIVISGCSTVGPEVIRAGRPAYNDAILQTNDEQLLQNIVRLRFGDSLGFLTVSSVTANVSVAAAAGVNIGAGPKENYSGNLVPISGNLTTEEHPTITYTPVSGDRMMRQFLGETPLELTILLINASQEHEQVWQAMVRCLNNLRNPDFIEPSGVETDLKFVEVIRLFSLLQQKGNLSWVRLKEKEPEFAILLHSYAPANSSEVAKLVGLLGVNSPAKEGDDIVIPVHQTAGTAQQGHLVIETRSLLGLMQLAASRIDLPMGMEPQTLGYGKPNSVADSIHIYSSAERPANTRVAVHYNGYWYYIKQTDQMSKRWFTMLHFLSNTQVPESVSIAPLLTIPVSGSK
jgi:hypothetical protein